jgi:hypothetical protein
MKAPSRLRRLIMGSVLVVSIAGSAFAQTAAAEPVEAPDVPDRIAVKGDYKVFLKRHAEGVQIYTCNGTAWTLVGPRANLYDDNGTVRGTHYVGPTWQDQDGSTVVGQRVDGVVVDTSAVAWLLLSHKSSTVGDDGNRMTNVSIIQRVNTVGGNPPGAGTCTAASTGATAESPYSADYYFWKKTGAH